MNYRKEIDEIKNIKIINEKIEKINNIIIMTQTYNIILSDNNKYIFEKKLIKSVIF